MKVLGCRKRNIFSKNFFKNDVQPVVHFYCKRCKIYIDTAENLRRTLCTNCENCECFFSMDKMNDGHFFIQIPFIPQIKNNEILDFNPDFSQNGVISDIFDGDLYKKLKSKLNLTNNSKLLTLVLNTDGVKVFKSRPKLSLWPIQLFINELPPTKHFKKENILLTAIWFGSSPDFHLYFKPFLSELKDLESDKINVQYQESNYEIFVRVLFGTFDSVAKPKLLSMKQFNGSYGCPYCYHPGEKVENSKSNHSVYPVRKCILRSHYDTAHNMRQYMITNETDLGVMGVSVLLGLKDYDLINGTVVDYMHGAYSECNLR